MLRPIARVLILLFLTTAFTTSALAEDTWSELQSPHFRVLTNGAPADARKVAIELEKMRFVMRWRFPGYRIDLDAPYTMYAARDYGTALRLAPSLRPREKPYAINDDGAFIDVTRRAFFPNWERNIGLVQLDTWEKAPHDRLYAAYVHEILMQNAPSLPSWLDRGLSEFLASTRFDGNDIILGAPIAGWPELKQQRLLPISEVLRGRKAQEWSNTEFLAWQLWAEESWALVHFLTFSPGMDSGAKLLTYLHQLQNDGDASAAFRIVFGDPAALDGPFAAYIHSKSLPAAVAPGFPVLDPASITNHPLSKAQALTEQAIFSLEEHDVQTARPLLQQALQLDPSLGTAHEELGFIDFGVGAQDSAREHWAKAVSLDPDRYPSALATVMTGTPYHEQTPEQLQASLTELRRIVHLHPLYAPAYTQVAIVLWWQKKVDTALRAAMEAQRLAPNRTGYQLLVARLLVANNQPTQAAALTRRVTNNPGIDGAAAAALWQSISAAQRDAGPAPVAKFPPGMVSATGTLVKMNCGDWQSRTLLHLNLDLKDPPPGQRIDLTASSRNRIGFDDTAWIGGGHSFVCHAAINRPARVLYKPGSKGYGELFAFSVIDDLPPVAADVTTATNGSLVKP